jgi:hypothetical protein
VNGFAFGRGEDWRPLRLVIDDATLQSAEVELLVALSNEEELEIWHTSESRKHRFEIRKPFDAFPGMRGAVSMRAYSLDTITSFGVYGTERLRERAAKLAEETSGDTEEVYRTLVFASAGDEHNCDGFVTRRPYILADEKPRAPIAVTPEDAVALAGLALRSRNNPSIGSDLMGLRLLGNTFYFILSRDLLREGWPWFGGCVASSSHTTDDSIVYLGQTVHERFARVLQIRDRLHRAAKQEPTRGNGDSVVFELESLLLFLSAVFDAAARVAHVVYINSDYEEAGWRRSGWRKTMTAAAPTLLALTADATEGAAILQIIAALRNTIHGEALRATAAKEPGGLTTQLVRVTPKEAEKLTERIAEIGDTPAGWGLRTDQRETTLAADRFVETLLPRAVTLLNELMAATDTSLLPGAAGSPLIRPIDDRPQKEWWNDMLSPEIRKRVRMLGGFAAMAEPTT